MNILKRFLWVFSLIFAVSFVSAKEVSSSITINKEERIILNKNTTTVEVETYQSTGGVCLAETNQARSSNGVNIALQNNNMLIQAAENHNNFMINNNCFSHQCNNEPNIRVRISNTGYNACGAGENIAAGQTDCPEVLNAWMNSAGHRANILGNYRDLGCATGECTGSSSNCLRILWTCVYANPC